MKGRLFSILLLTALLAILPGAAWAAPTGQSQHIEPGQTLEGLTAADWQAIQEAMRAAEYHPPYHVSPTPTSPRPTPGRHEQPGCDRFGDVDARHTTTGAD